MNQNPGIEAVRKLAHLGYRFTVNGETIKARYEGQGEPDPLKAKPLIDLARQHKTEVVEFLRCYCPRCGGCCFVPDYDKRSLCLTCDWPVLVELYPGLKVKH
jgi:ribosomal protein S27AE